MLTVDENTIPPLIELSDSLKLVRMLHERGLLTSVQRDNIFHALNDIARSTREVYGSIIPTLLNSTGMSDDEIEDYLFDLRDAFRHIDYHIHDAGLGEYIWVSQPEESES